MQNIKVCPKCIYMTDSKYDDEDIRNCPYCNTQLIDTQIPEDKRMSAVFKLEKKYKKEKAYDNEAWRGMIKYIATRAKAAEATANAPTLTTCPVCQGKVSSAATACPHCGQPMNGGQVAPTRPEPTGPKCPHCGCTNIRKIGTFDRLTSIGVWGLASGKIGKQYECWQCKHKW